MEDKYDYDKSGIEFTPEIPIETAKVEYEPDTAYPTDMGKDETLETDSYAPAGTSTSRPVAASNTAEKPAEQFDFDLESKYPTGPTPTVSDEVGGKKEPKTSPTASYNEEVNIAEKYPTESANPENSFQRDSTTEQYEEYHDTAEDHDEADWLEERYPTGPPVNEKKHEDQNEEMKDAVKGTDAQIKNLQDWLDANQQESPEEKAKREKRERAQSLIASISDGLMAASNLIFTGRYAPNMYDPSTSQSDALREQFDRLKAEREANKDKYLNFSLKLGDLQNQRAATVREVEAHQQKLRDAKEKAAREAEEHKWKELLQPDIQREKREKANKAKQDAIAAKAVADYAEEREKAKVETEKAHAEAYKASANASNASAKNSLAHASTVNQFTAYDENGDSRHFNTKDAAIEFSKQHGTYNEMESTTTSTTTNKNKNGSVKSSSTTTSTKKTGHAGKPSPTKKSPTK